MNLLTELKSAISQLNYTVSKIQRFVLLLRLFRAHRVSDNFVYSYVHDCSNKVSWREKRTDINFDLDRVGVVVDFRRY